MKALILSLLLCATLASGAIFKNITLEWSYPPNELTTNISFNVYSTTNVALPLAMWPLITNVSGLKTNVAIPIQSGIYFYYVTATNFTGESDPSNTVSAQVPRSGELKIKGGP